MSKTISRSLAVWRKRLGYEQKQIAILLGHETKHQISRYENGQRVPDLKAAIKLAILYGLPIQVLFDGYFRRCTKELKARLKKFDVTIKADLDTSQDYCSFLENIDSIPIDGRSFDKVRHHIKILIDERQKRTPGN